MKQTKSFFDLVVVTCEHAGNKVPARFEFLFQGKKRLLATHEGWDIGAWDAAKSLAKGHQAPLFGHQTTRLLVEGNRGLTSRTLFSKFSKNLPDQDLKWLLDHSWFPFRLPAAKSIMDALKKGKRVLHLSVHSFTPVWKGKTRSVDLGFMFDPSVAQEKTWVKSWKKVLKKRTPSLRLANNRPYSGLADGFAQSLRNRLQHTNLIAMQIEINQAFPLGDSSRWKTLKKDLLESLLAANRG